MNRRNFLVSGMAGVALAARLRALARSDAAGVDAGSRISIEDFGASPINSPPANTAAINRAIAAAEGGPILRGVYFPPGTYPVYGRIEIRRGNVALLLEGATLVGSATGQGSTQVPGVRIVTFTGSSNVRIVGGRLIERSGVNASFLFDIGGRNIEVDGTTFEKRPSAFGGYTGYIRANSDSVLFDGFRIRGGNGLYIEGRNHRFTNFDIEAGPPPGGDDSFALKAIQGTTSNIRVGPGRVRNYAAVLSIGSEVGVLGRDDPSNSRAVRDVVVSSIIAENCSHVALIKPGAISAYDYRDGLVEDVLIENITLTDLSGAKFQRGIAVTASRGAKVRRFTARNINIVARAYSAGAAPTVGAVDCYIVDNHREAASISEVSVQVKYTDPYRGAPNAPRRPGHPVQYVARAALQTPGKGHMANILFDIEGDGSRELGILIGAGLDNAVEIRRAVLRNVSANPSSTLGRGGIFARSRVRLGHIEITPRNGRPLAGPSLR